MAKHHPAHVAYALVDTDTGRVVSAKSVKLFPGILNCTARFASRRARTPKRPRCRSHCRTARR